MAIAYFNAYARRRVSTEVDPQIPLSLVEAMWAS